MARPRVPLPPPPMRWGLVAVVAGAIALASVAPPPAGTPSPGSSAPFGTDKLLHFVAYLALSVTLATALAGRTSREADLRVLAAALLFAVGYGLAVEAVQAGLPARRFDPADGLANAAGAAVGVGLWRSLVRRVDLRPVDGDGGD